MCLACADVSFHCVLTYTCKPCKPSLISSSFFKKCNCHEIYSHSPENIVSLPFLMAMRAAMKKVLSPNSDTKMAPRDATKPDVKPRPLLVGAAAGNDVELNAIS